MGNIEAPISPSKKSWPPWQLTTSHSPGWTMPTLTASTTSTTTTTTHLRPGLSTRTWTTSISVGWAYMAYHQPFLSGTDGTPQQQRMWAMSTCCRLLRRTATTTASMTAATDSLRGKTPTLTNFLHDVLLTTLWWSGRPQLDMPLMMRKWENQWLALLPLPTCYRSPRGWTWEETVHYIHHHHPLSQPLSCQPRMCPRYLLYVIIYYGWVLMAHPGSFLLYIYIYTS